MANTIKWLPNSEPDIGSYRIDRSSASAGPFSSLVSITHDLDGPDFDGTHFFYDDATGTSAHWYRLVSIDTDLNASTPTAAFQAAKEQPTPPAETVALSANYSGVGTYKVVDNNGAPVSEAQIRVYTKTDYDANNLANPVGVAYSTTTGEWQTPVVVSPSTTYVIYVVKPNVFKATTVEVTV